jgi:hypothetical protein
MRIFRLACAALLLAGIVSSFVAAPFDPAMGLAQRIGIFASFFTIVANCLLAAALALPELAPGSAAGRMLARPSVRGGIVVYAVMVGLIYILLLRQLGSPTGLQALADAILHYGAPVIAVVDWVVFVPRGLTRFRDALAWLAVPLAYAAWTLAHGAVASFYPYPFVDVAALGLRPVLAHMALILAGFLGLGLAVVLIDRTEASRAAARPQRRWP